jgi:hypothetical protein
MCVCVLYFSEIMFCKKYVGRMLLFMYIYIYIYVCVCVCVFVLNISYYEEARWCGFIAANIQNQFRSMPVK